MDTALVKSRITPLNEGRFMRRLEVERIDDVMPIRGKPRIGGRRATAGVADTGRARHPPGLGPEMRPRGLKFPPANPRRWPAARAASLVWRLRAVPRTHGPGRPWGSARLGTTACLRGAR